MLPTVPATVWEQIPVIIVFSLLLAGLGWLLVKLFSKSIADINAHYAAIIKSNNEQWQKYFDARTDSDRLVSDQVVKQLQGLTAVVEKLVADFDAHDQMERQALDSMSDKRSRLTKKS